MLEKRCEIKDESGAQAFLQEALFQGREGAAHCQVECEVDGCWRKRQAHPITCDTVARSLPTGTDLLISLSADSAIVADAIMYGNAPTGLVLVAGADGAVFAVAVSGLIVCSRSAR